MNEKKFWDLIQTSRKRMSNEEIDGNMDIQTEDLTHLLSSLSPDNIVEFKKLYEGYMNQAYRWDLWGAAYVIGGGCSDDGFTDFRAWLISMGKKVYELALISPDDLLVAASDPTVECCFFEEFSYISDEVYEEKTGEELEFEIEHPEEPNGKEWNEEELSSLFPKLTEKFE